MNTRKKSSGSPRPGRKKGTDSLTAETLRMRIMKLATTLAKASHRGSKYYPVQYDHCFLRIAYDHACQMQWTNKVKRPFIRNASLPQLQRAYKYLRQMKEEPVSCIKLNEQSLQWRGHSEA